MVKSVNFTTGTCRSVNKFNNGLVVNLTIDKSVNVHLTMVKSAKTTGKSVTLPNARVCKNPGKSANLTMGRT